MLYLASQSPRRRELLDQIGIAYGVLDVNVPEQRLPSEPPIDYVSRVAREKAGAGLLQVMSNNSAVVLGADTEVVLDDVVYGKPVDDEDAARMLRELSGKTHQVMHAMAVGDHFAVLIRGDHEANENKIRRAVGAKKLALAETKLVEEVTGAPVGFAGPVGLKKQVPIWADEDVAGMANMIIGANEGDHHYVGANLDRDFKIDQFADLRNATAGDPSPKSDAKLELRHAVEIGHVFKLGTKYSQALGAKFLDDKEQQHTIIMGCYGIGVNRILASLIETKSNADGIVWPMSIAPYEVIVSSLNAQEAEVQAAAEKLYGELQALGIEVLYDDRDQRPGVKFKDADFIGIPLRVVVCGRGLKEGHLEPKWRTKAAPARIPVAGAAQAAAKPLAGTRGPDQ